MQLSRRVHGAHGGCGAVVTAPDASFISLEPVTSDTSRRGLCCGALRPALFSISCFVFRFDEAALSIQKEKNIYKEIENYPTCYKVCFQSA